MQQSGIGTVVGATTSEVLKKLKEGGQDQDRRKQVRPGKDRVSISAEARELIASDQESSDEEIAPESVEEE